MKYKIKLSSGNKNLKIPITGIGNLLGYDDDILALVNNETNTSINDVSDLETRRILPTGSSVNLQFKFIGTGNPPYKVAPLEFTGITDNTTSAAKSSFYLMQIFDTFIDETQTKLHTGYYNGYEFAKNSLSSDYINAFVGNNEFTNLYLSQYYLDKLSGQTTTLYMKFFFYSGKSGKVYTFYNDNNGAITTPEKLYYKINLYPLTLKYDIVGSPATIVYTELNNLEYNTAINKTTTSFPVQKTTYPSGNTFTNTGNYTTI